MAQGNHCTHAYMPSSRPRVALFPSPALDRHAFAVSVVAPACPCRVQRVPRSRLAWLRVTGRMCCSAQQKGVWCVDIGTRLVYPNHGTPCHAQIGECTVMSLPRQKSIVPIFAKANEQKRCTPQLRQHLIQDWLICVYLCVWERVCMYTKG